MYGATGGQAFINGVAGERFCVRNSGVHAVVEAVGDHGCEYMTGGVVVVLGPTGRNFAAGMSGGIAFVNDSDGDFHIRFNDGLADLEPVVEDEDIATLKGMIEEHYWHSGSGPAAKILADWDSALSKFKKLCPGTIAECWKNGSSEGRQAGSWSRNAWVNPPDLSTSSGAHPSADPQQTGYTTTGSSTTAGRNRPARGAGRKMHGLRGALLPHRLPIGKRDSRVQPFVYMGDWENALRALLSTNNFPEFTGRICPAPCEASCVLSINTDPVTIEYVEKEIADRGYEQGWIRPNPPAIRTGKKVAVVGSGPAGLAAAQQLNRAGHWVTVFERAEYIGGLLVLGIPDFKLDKEVLRRRLAIMEEEGINFETGVNVGVDISAEKLLRDFDAVCLACGSTVPRDLPVPGRDLDGVHFAMDYLTQQNRLNAGQQVTHEERLTAEGKRVVILGGGDTGADCLGTAHRQGAELVSQYELLAEPPVNRPAGNPWPQWPRSCGLPPPMKRAGFATMGYLPNRSREATARSKSCMRSVWNGASRRMADARQCWRYRTASLKSRRTWFFWQWDSCTRSTTDC